MAEQIFFDKLYTIEYQGLFKKNEKRGNLYIKFILDRNFKNHENIANNNSINNNNTSFIELTNKNSILEYNHIFNNDSYNSDED